MVLLTGGKVLDEENVSGRLNMHSIKILIMKTKHPMLKSSQLMIFIAITVASVSFVVVLGNVRNIMAQVDYFAQPVRVNIDKTNQIIGNYGLVLKDMDSENHIENIYSDSPYSPRNVFIDGTINVHDGDRLVGCIMNINAQDMACDMQTAHYGQSITEFFVDMNKASPVPQQNNDDNGGNQQGEVDKFNPNSSSNASNANNDSSSNFSNNSTYLPTTVTKTVY
jgi:hypothetical protein